LTLDELREAVSRAPDDDAPREVLADALLEAGDPQGELIHLQLRTALAPHDRDLGMRERELVSSVGPAIVRGLPRGGYLLRRGSPERARLQASLFTADAAEILRRRGPVLELDLHEPGLAAFCASAPLDGLRAIRLHEPDLTMDELRELARRLPPSVREIGVFDSEHGADLARLFTQLPLRRLAVSGFRDPLEVALALVESSIDEIDFSEPGLGDDGAEALAAHPAIGRRGSLDLRECTVGARGVAALAASPRLAGLRTLVLDHILGDDGARALAAPGAPLAASLEHIGIAELALPFRRPVNARAITFDGIDALARGSFPRLRSLSVAFFDSDENMYPRWGPIFANLERVELANVSLEPHDLRMLLDAAPRLRHLALRNCRITLVEHASFLAARDLDSLDLSGNRIPVTSDIRRILRRKLGWRVDFEPKWEAWVAAP
jgi:uncharacterized protein (TIGR02996 family)